MPERIQRKRTKGWRMPENAVYVGRPTKWGNPFAVGDFGIPDRAAAVERFREWLDGRVVGPTPPTARQIAELRGKYLACWCPLDGAPCHADVLLELANP